MDYLASVVQAIPGEDYTVYAYFSDGSVRKADIKPIIAKGGIFTPLADERFFRERLRACLKSIYFRNSMI